MKICFISQDFSIARGGNLVFLNLLKELSKDNSVVVISAKHISGFFPFKQEVAPYASRHNLYWLNGNRFSKAAYKKFIEIKDREQFDVVLINQVIGKDVEKFSSLNSPSIYIVHHPASADIDIIKKEENWFSGLKWRVRYFSMFGRQKRILENFKNIVTVSKSSKDRIVSDYGIEPQKIEVIYNGIDLDFFKKVADTQPRTVLSLGSYMHPRRGFRYLLEAYKLFSSKGFSIIDVGARTEKDSLLLSQIPNIKSLGSVDESVLPELYSKASVFISTSLFEGFGLAIMESLACDTPAVAFSGGAVGEVLSMIDPDLVVDNRDVESLVKKAIYYSENRVSYKDKVWKNFSLGQMVENYRNYLHKLVSPKQVVR